MFTLVKKIKLAYDAAIILQSTHSREMNSECWKTPVWQAHVTSLSLYLSHVWVTVEIRKAKRGHTQRRLPLGADHGVPTGILYLFPSLFS